MKNVFKICSLMLVFFMLCACAPKKALTTNEVSNVLEKHGFLLNDETSLMEDKTIKYVGSANNGKFQIEYYVFNNEKDAIEAYQNNKKSFESNKVKGKEKSKDVYNKYTQKLDDTYNVIIRVENTLLYSSINIEYKKDLNKIINDLNY